jgi:hypothetical protein
MAMRRFKGRIFVWLSALGLGLALVAFLVATGESIRHVERVAPLIGAAQHEDPGSDSRSSDAYRAPGSSVWMTP